MIDLHMHSIHSDGTESCISILKKCEEKKVANPKEPEKVLLNIIYAQS